MLNKKINPIWMSISVAFGLAVLTKETLNPTFVATGLAFSVFGGYLIGRAEENYMITKKNTSIYRSLKHPMYLGTSLFLMGVSVAMESVVLWIVALVWTIGALYLAWKESHSSSSS